MQSNNDRLFEQREREREGGKREREKKRKREREREREAEKRVLGSIPSTILILKY